MLASLRSKPHTPRPRGEPVGRRDRLFHEFDLEEVVPDDHLLRKIDTVLDLSWPPVDLSRAADPHAFGRLPPRHPRGATLVPGGEGEPGLALVPRLGPGGQGSPSFDLPDQPPKAMSPRAPERRWAAVDTVGRPEERFTLEPEQPAGDVA